MLEAGLECLEMAVDGGLVDIVWLEHCPLLRAVEGDPRFVRARDRVRGRAEAVLMALR